MRLTVIGSSPAWPNPGGAHAGYVVEAAGAGRLLLDCGPGVLARLRRDGLLPVDAVAITHLHLDHWGDLVPWAWFARHADPSGNRPVLFLPPGGVDALAGFAHTFGSEGMFSHAFDVREYAPRVPFDAARFEVTAVPVDHYDTVAFGFRVRDRDGRTLAYSGDTGPCRGLFELAQGAHLFLCEATLRDGTDDSDVRGHLSADEALAVPAPRTLLTHRPAELVVPDGAVRATDALAVDV